jgi:[ribosomal protein S18]-alanine N-acetyltransferase
MPDEIRVSVADESDLAWCAQLMSSTDPWLAYKFSIDTCTRILHWPGSTLFMARVNESLAGFLLLHPKGFLGCPYIAVIAIVAGQRSRGIGAHMLEFAESHFAGSRHVYLCVSSFNLRALRFYERCGYVKVGELPNFIAEGFSEFVMQKRL